ncbi:Glutaryl-CoA dehydrogenase [Pseudovibrio axinellae]|uniref:Glutaryl-CoA dehydrogenase n=1 Tax=Pseudovibrio axinellae TaxID=989403 RepID=A0A165XYY0_9HYPH|nr:acyl-CoA dehydrogenase family protein [Pseudovibrio axinellae]KZL18256.1 Glutaryl-CoA dehydrogenase [Pseudovibrio axinellae]SER72273.1 acyl-CoA dehydrogenase [Pseudovibrio axinellae]
MTSLDEFRMETRAWLEENCPQELRRSFTTEDDICWGGRNWTFKSEAQKQWLERMAARGWTVPSWPKEYGGAGLNGDEAKVLKEEMKRINAISPLESLGMWMLGPALLKYGTHEQKLEHLPKIARGEIRWCQGYSEPGSGSDLASLQTKGVDMGDHFLVSGQKIWTSYADQSDWIFALVRTEPEASKHKGISFLLFDMNSEGVTTKPIPLISGNSPFCETFFDEVKVPMENIVDTRGNGWTIAKYLLTHERETVSSLDGIFGRANGLYKTAADAVGLDETGRLDDPLLRADIGDFLVDEMALTAHLAVANTYSRAGNQLGARSAELKYLGTELNKRRQSLVVQSGGLEALSGPEEKNGIGSETALWLRSKGNTIEGGTSEIMLSIISKAVLRLPSLG